MESNFEIIEKESINVLSFPESEVLDNVEDRKNRFNELTRAMLLGNLEHLKTKIFFEDNQSKKVVETTIWGVTDQKIILKQGMVIPIHRIYRSI